MFRGNIHYLGSEGRRGRGSGRDLGGSFEDRCNICEGKGHRVIACPQYQQFLNTLKAAADDDDDITMESVAEEEKASIEILKTKDFTELKVDNLLPIIETKKNGIINATPREKCEPMEVCTLTNNQSIAKNDHVNKENQFKSRKTISNHNLSVNKRAKKDNFQSETMESVDLNVQPSVELTSSTPNNRRNSKKKNNDITTPIFKLPFKYGWKRELVYRNTGDSTAINHANIKGDVYYYSPNNQKLRSYTEIKKQLDLSLNEENTLTIASFTFLRQPIGMSDKSKEIIRKARTKVSKIKKKKIHQRTSQEICMDDTSPMEYDIPSTPGCSINLKPMIPSQSDESPQMPVHDLMSNLNLEHQIPFTSAGIVDSPSYSRITIARARKAQNTSQRSAVSISPPPKKKPEKRKPGRPPGRPKKQPVRVQLVDLQLENEDILLGAFMNSQISLQMNKEKSIKKTPEKRKPGRPPGRPKKQLVQKSSGQTLIECQDHSQTKQSKTSNDISPQLPIHKSVIETSATQLVEVKASTILQGEQNIMIKQDPAETTEEITIIKTEIKLPQKRKTNNKKLDIHLKHCLECPKSPLMVFSELFNEVPIILQERQTPGYTFYIASIEVDGVVYTGNHISKIQAKEQACENLLRVMLAKKINEQPGKEEESFSETDEESGENSSSVKSKGPPQEDFPWSQFVSLAMHNLIPCWGLQPIS